MKRPVAVLAALAALAAVHEALALALDRAELVERLLSPGPDALIAIAFALALYGARLALLFLGPGLAAIALASLVGRGRDRAKPRALTEQPAPPGSPPRPR